MCGMQHPAISYRLGEGFSKTERLCSEKLIARLYQSGDFISKYPLRINLVLCELPENVPCQVVFTVGKKRFPSAVNRNRIKRLMRELYRKSKMPVYHYLNENGKQLAMSMIYTGKELPDFQMLEKQWTSMQKRIMKKLDEMIMFELRSGEVGAELGAEAQKKVGGSK